MPESSRRDIPFGPQFSPEQTPLPDLLKIVATNSGTYDRLVGAIRKRFFERGKGDEYNKTKKADNTTLALRDYGILDEDKATLTSFGKSLVTLVDDPPALYDALAKHILLNLNGLTFVRTIEDLAASGQEITLETLPRALARRGLRVPPTATHISAMKGWLRMAGVFSPGRTSYRVNSSKVQGLLGGLAGADTDALADLSPLQRAFLKALARFPANEAVRSNDVAELAEKLYGVAFPWKSIRASVLDACAEAGFITFEKTTKGRGAKPHLVRPTAKFDAVVVVPLLDQYRDTLGSRLRDMLRMPLLDVIRDLDSADKNRKGKALELLALRLTFLLDLDFVDWRRRGKETAGAEVDVIVESARLIFSRWQIQCKNGRATLEDVAKEVGIAQHLNSTVIMVVSTRQFSRDAHGYADAIMRKSNLQVILLQGSDLAEIKRSPARIVDVLQAQARHAMDVKKLDVAKVITGLQEEGTHDEEV